MIVVTISKWRQKLVWLLAAILVAAVLLGQLAGREPAGLASRAPGNTTGPAAGQQQEQAATAPAGQDAGFLEDMLQKLRGFYRGE